MARTLLLVDSNVASYAEIVAAVKDNVTPVVFNGKTDTYVVILAKIAAAHPFKAPYLTVGIVQDGNSTGRTYSLTLAETPAVLSDFSTWSGIIGFFKALRDTYIAATVDLISCLIYANPAWVSALDNLEAATKQNFRASKDLTGNLANGGNWVMESDNVNIEGVYFTEEIKKYTRLLFSVSYRSSNRMVDASDNDLSHPMISQSNPVNGMVYYPSGGYVVSWGIEIISSSVPADLSGVTAIASNDSAFAALENDGTVVTWGNSNNGGDSSAVSASLVGVTAIASSNSAFAALKNDGTVVTWGWWGEGGDSSAVSASLVGVAAIASTHGAFAALKNDGTVVTWGNGYGGGDSSAVSASLVGVAAIASTDNAFAALKDDGTVVTWGNGYYGGDSSAVSSSLVNVTAIASNSIVFAALTGEGTVVTWGADVYGGNSSAVSSSLVNVKAIASNPFAFAAITGPDNTVVTWGPSWGGADSSAVSSSLVNVKAITSNNYAFAALKNDGTVVTWGTDWVGGDSSTVSASLVNVTAISSAAEAFAAIKDNGTVVTWGGSAASNSSEVSTSLVGVTAISSTFGAFAAIKDNGSVVTWGSQYFGGNSSAISYNLSSGVKAIASTGGAFAAITTTKPLPPITIVADTPTPPYGSSFTLSIVNVSSEPADATYQWYKDGSAMSGATTNTYGVSSANVAASGSYYLIRNDVVVSNTVTISLASINITSTSPTLSFGGSFTLSIVDEPSITNPTYQWYKDGSAISDDAESSTYVVSSANAADSGIYYLRWNNVIDSGSVTISLPSVTITSDNNSPSTGGTFTLSIVDAPTNPPSATVAISYQWYKNGDPLANANSSTYEVSNASSTDSGNYYLRWSDLINSNGAYIYVPAPPPTFTTQLAGGSLVDGAYTLTVATENAGYYYLYMVRNGQNEYISYSPEPSFTITAQGSYVILAYSPDWSSSVASNIFVVSSPGGGGGGNVVCFPAGERVRTTTGYRAVEDLRRGDRLVTADGRSVSAVVYRLSVPHATEKTAPYHIPAHTFGRNSPPADIRLSPQHAFQIGKGLWHIPAAAAQTHSAISQYGVGESITYYHLELPNYFTDNIVMEGGAVVESFAYRQVPRGARIYTYNAARDAYTRPRSAKDVIGKTA